MLELIAHEMGHIHEKQTFNNAPQEVRNALIAEWKNWAKTITGTTPGEDVVNALRAKTSAQKTKIQPGVLAKDIPEIDSYWRSFGEWYADQTAKWAVSSEKPVSIVEKFFAKLGAALRKFYQTLKGQKYLPNETFKQYLDNQAEKLNLSPEPKFEPISTGLQQGFEFSKMSLEGIDPKVAQMAETTFGKQEPKSYVDTVKDLAGKYRDRFKYMIADDLSDIEAISKEGYMKGRLSKTVDTQMQVILDYGQLEVRGGTLGYKKGTKGLKEIYAPLGNEVERFQIWLALNRDANLPSDKRSFKDDLIKNRDQFIQGDINGVPRKQVYEKARVEQQALNKSVLDVSKQLGLIDDKAYQRFANDAFYIPFYKEMENGDVEGARIASKLTGQKFSHALKGGEKKVNDLMDNMLRNWSHIISASLKNDAALTTLKDAEKLGVATRVKDFQKSNPDVVKVMENGVPTYFKVEDQNLIDNIAQINYVGKQSALFKAMTKPSSWLRYGVTLNPAYKIRNLVDRKSVV